MKLRHDPAALHRLEDRLADRLAERVAHDTGACLLVAHAPRAMIDLNRGPDDLDWDMVEGSPPAGAAQRSSRRARSGLGLIPRRLPDLGDLWKRPIEQEDFENRVRYVHAPYHHQLEISLKQIRSRWGAALLIDLHSMPPLRASHGGVPAVRFVMGDRFGASCDGSILSASFGYFARVHQPVSHNVPYAGGYVLERHASRMQGLHAVQLEVCRSMYLDASLQNLSSRFESTVRLVSGLVLELSAEVAALGRAQSGLLAAE